MKSAGDCRRRILEIYGDPLEAPAGVLHIAAVWRDPDGRLPTLRIEADTPRSATDRFTLGLARARADAVLTTGRILREEPALRHRYHEEPAIESALTEWRRAVLGKRHPPTSAVLTSGRALELDHPLFAGPAPVRILTSPGAAAALRDRGLPQGVTACGVEPLTVWRAIGMLRERGSATVAVEAGASTSRALYEPVLRVDELCLSFFAEAGLGASLRGPAFLPAGRLAALFGPPSSLHAEREPDGRWLFARFRSRP
jgi:riboflavin biosynthesis pyrimidine reductase